MKTDEELESIARDIYECIKYDEIGKAIWALKQLQVDAANPLSTLPGAN